MKKKQKTKAPPKKVPQKKRTVDDIVEDYWKCRISAIKAMEELKQHGVTGTKATGLISFRK